MWQLLPAWLTIMRYSTSLEFKRRRRQTGNPDQELSEINSTTCYWWSKCGCTWKNIRAAMLWNHMYDHVPQASNAVISYIYTYAFLCRCDTEFSLDNCNPWGAFVLQRQNQVGCIVCHLAHFFSAISSMIAHLSLHPSLSCFLRRTGSLIFLNRA